MRNVIIFIVSLLIVNSLYGQKYLYSNDELQFSDALGETTFGAKNIIHWPVNSITWYMNQAGAGDGLTPAQSEMELKKGFQEWEDIDDCDIDFTYGGRVSNTYGVDQKNVVYWSVFDDDYDNDLSSNLGSYAVTYFTINSNKEIVEVDIVFTGLDEVQFGPNTIYINWNNDGTDEDIWEFTTHEVGHLLGLAHTTNNSASMFPGRGLFRRDVNSEDEFGASFITAGNIIENTTLPAWNNIYFDWPIKIKAGVTLTYNPYSSASTIHFGNGSYLSIYGDLDVNGTSSNDGLIDFKTKTSSNGIKVYSGGSAYIDHAEIKNARYGVYANVGEVDIDNSNIHDCNYGVYLYNTNSAPSDPAIVNTYIEDNSSYGV